MAHEFRPVQVDLDVLEDQLLERWYVSGNTLWERRANPCRIGNEERGGNMDVHLLMLTAGLLMSSVAAAQIHTATGPAPRPKPAAKKAAHNSMASTTTPLNCQQYRWPSLPHPGVKPDCDRIEARTLQNEARRVGRSGPSDDVISLPALGSDEAARSGHACVGGQAMLKLPNGWEQVSSQSGG